jgi:hypothetical protein
MIAAIHLCTEATMKKWNDTLESVGFMAPWALETLMGGTRKGKTITVLEDPQDPGWGEVVKYLASQGFSVKYEM